MNLKDILNVSGKSGLFKLIANNKNGVIVESLMDNKRFPIFSNDKISSLDEICVYSDSNEEVPLKKVLVNLYKYQNHQAIDESVIKDGKKLAALFTAFFQNFDKERVYSSHQKKICIWYNELLSHDMLDENIEDDTITEEAKEENPIKDETNS